MADIPGLTSLFDLRLDSIEVFNLLSEKEKHFINFHKQTLKTVLAESGDGIELTAETIWSGLMIHAILEQSEVLDKKTLYLVYASLVVDELDQPMEEGTDGKKET